MARHLLLMSSSKVGNTTFLEQNRPIIDRFLKHKALIEQNSNRVHNVLFVPFAAVKKSFDDYFLQVCDALQTIQISLSSLHHADNPARAIEEASAILVGGGNTFYLLHQLYQLNLVNAIQEQVNNGKPYIGWSAGANIATPSIHTTNDMPIVYPKSFAALGLVGFQINPHYSDHHPEGFNGETRDDRIAEFLALNPSASVVALPEGNSIEIHNKKVTLHQQTDTQKLTRNGKQIINQKQLQKLYLETLR